MGNIKRLGTLLFVIILFICLKSYAVDNWYPPTQAHVAWDAVTPTTVGDNIKYNVYISLTQHADQVKMTATPIGTIEYVIDFLGQLPNNWLAGVSAVEETPDPNDPTAIIFTGESEISWSDVPTDCKDGKTFGFVYRVPPGKTKNLERKVGN